MHSVEKSEQCRIIWLNQKQKAVNLFDRSMIDWIDRTLDEIASEKDVRGIIFASRKAHSFIAGADVDKMLACGTKEEATRMSTAAQELCNKISRLPFTTVAAIDGVCLGAGLELALSCDARVASIHPKTCLGLPQVRLGLIPSAGGTQRLPHLLDLEPALEMLLKGKLLSYRQAHEQGLVDETVHSNALLHSAQKWARKPKKNIDRERDWFRNLLKNNFVSRKVALKQARTKLEDRPSRLNPAPAKILDCVEASFESPAKKGMDLEKENFGNLALTQEAKNLMWLFCADREIKKENKAFVSGYDCHLETIGIVGAGRVGAGVAYLTSAKANSFVRLKDLGRQELAIAQQKIRASFKYLQSKENLSEFQVRQKFNRITVTTTNEGLQKVDLILEAVSEDINLKKKLLSDLESLEKKNRVLATTTSTGPLSEIASELKSPKNLVGMHYFYPVEKIPVVEVIKGERTSNPAMAAATALALEQGKRVINVKDSCGFFSTRVLAFYLSEAARCLNEGYSIEDIDGAVTAMGFAMGPFELADSIGIDVVCEIAAIMEKHYPGRFELPIQFDRLLEEGFNGKKSGRGFYKYKNAERGDGNDKIYPLLHLSSPEHAKKQERSNIGKRCLYSLCCEAVRTLQEGVIHSPRDGDYASVFGLGFPAVAGGPFHFIDAFGIGQFVNEIKQWQAKNVIRFEAPEMLINMIEDQSLFFESLDKGKNNLINTILVA